MVVWRCVSHTIREVVRVRWFQGWFNIEGTMILHRFYSTSLYHDITHHPPFSLCLFIPFFYGSSFIFSYYSLILMFFFFFSFFNSDIGLFFLLERYNNLFFIGVYQFFYVFSSSPLKKRDSLYKGMFKIKGHVYL